MKPCLHCGNPVNNRYAKYCSVACQHAFQHQKTDAEVFKTGDLHPHYQHNASRKAFLLRHNEHRCSVCNRTEWEGVPIPMVMDHEDGNPTNHRLENLRLVCGNCDMLLPTYKGKNKGSGRYVRTDKSP